MPQYTVGERLRSRVSTAEVVIIRAPEGDPDLTCAGMAMAGAGDPGAEDDRVTGGDLILIGKRYEDADSGLEVLCVVAGAGPLAVDGRALGLKSAKPLPASD